MAAYQEGSLVRLQTPQFFTATPEPSHPAALANRFISVQKCGANRSTPLGRLYNNEKEVTLSPDSCSTPFVGIATQVATNVEKYSALSDQLGANL